MNHEPRWNEEPPPRQERRGRILRIDSPTRVELCVLTDNVEKVWTHAIPWNKSIRTYPCTGNPETCWFDHATTSCRWQGWLGVQKPFGREYLFVALTPAAYMDATFQAAKDGNLRGRMLWLSRVGMEVNSRLHAILSLAIHTDAKLLPRPDTRAFLRSLWGLPHTWPAQFRNLLPTSSGDDEPDFKADHRRRP